MNRNLKRVIWVCKATILDKDVVVWVLFKCTRSSKCNTNKGLSWIICVIFCLIVFKFIYKYTITLSHYHTITQNIVYSIIPYLKDNYLNDINMIRYNRFEKGHKYYYVVYKRLR